MLFFLPPPRHDAFENLTLVIDGPPKVMSLTIDLHDHLLGHASMPCRATPSSRCQRHLLDRMPETRRFRISAANNGPNRFHQNRTVSWLISMPRSCSRSSTCRNDSGNRIYSITVRRMISGEVLKYRNGDRWVIPRGYATTLPVSSRFRLTEPASSIEIGSCLRRHKVLPS